MIIVVLFLDAKTTVNIPTNNDMNLDETSSVYFS